ncbi:hypothetical protein [Parasphingorhabdus sp.]|uniref:hypothetical protein n=1 Tax=Parasphingorhabdus sp. TaxID=2709688 RepID=UPI0032ECE027
MSLSITKVATAATVSLLLLSSQPTIAGWKHIKVESNEVGKGGMTVVPLSEWNRWSKRESNRGESWTKNGFPLNRIDFFSQIEAGESIYKERSKKHQPLPKFQSDMLLPDVAELFKANFSIVTDATGFEVTKLEPANLGSVPGLKVSYTYLHPNDPLTRLGEARMAVYNERLYVINYTAPRLHYFDENISEARAIMDNVILN